MLALNPLGIEQSEGPGLYRIDHLCVNQPAGDIRRVYAQFDRLFLPVSNRQEQGKGSEKSQQDTGILAGAALEPLDLDVPEPGLVTVVL